MKLDAFQFALCAGCLALAGMLGAACGGNGQEIKHYRLAPQVQRAQAADQAQRPVLAIEYFTVDSAYDENQIAYRTDPYQVNYYYYHRWASTPGLMVADTMRQGYQATGLFESVTTGGVARADVVLSGRIAAIEEVDVTEEKWLARLALELRLRDARTGTLLWSRIFEEEQPLDDRSPSGLAKGVSAAIARIVETTAPEFANMASQTRLSVR